ncbi:MAG: hypothetical protein RR444_09375 [Oscillospiraceae bacterium]
MEFGAELKDFLIVVFKRWWVILICVIVFCIAAVPVAQGQYSEAQVQYTKSLNNVEAVQAINSSDNVILDFGLSKDVTEQELNDIMEMTEYLQDYTVIKRIWEDISGQLSQPLTFSTFKNSIIIGPVDGYNLLCLSIKSSNQQDAKLIQDALLNEIDHVYQSIIPDANGMSVIAAGNNKISEEQKVQYPAPPSWKSIVSSVLFLYAAGGILLGCLIVLMWNGLRPVLGSAEAIRNKEHIKVYGPIKFK